MRNLEENQKLVRRLREENKALLKTLSGLGLVCPICGCNRGMQLGIGPEIHAQLQELEDSRVHVRTIAGQLVRARRELVVLRPIAQAVAGE